MFLVRKRKIQDLTRTEVSLRAKAIQGPAPSTINRHHLCLLLMADLIIFPKSLSFFLFSKYDMSLNVDSFCIFI